MYKSIINFFGFYFNKYNCKYNMTICITLIDSVLDLVLYQDDREFYIIMLLLY